MLMNFVVCCVYWYRSNDAVTNHDAILDWTFSASPSFLEASQNTELIPNIGHAITLVQLISLYVAGLSNVCP
jgi:hypothetical protein